MCPECGSYNTRVTDSRKNFKIVNVTYRRRVCEKCHRKFSTYELNAKEYDKLFKAYRLYETIKRNINF